MLKINGTQCGKINGLDQTIYSPQQFEFKLVEVTVSFRSLCLGSEPNFLPLIKIKDLLINGEVTVL